MFTITLTSATSAVAGRLIGFTATRSGGTAWTNAATSLSAPLSLSGISGAVVVNLATSGGNVCKGVAYTGHQPGTLTLTDIDGNTQMISVGATQALHPTTGTTRHVQGGVKNVPAPTATVVGINGSTRYAYQIIGVNAAGKTMGQPAKIRTMANQPVSNTIQQEFTGPRIATVNVAPDTMDGSNNMSLAWYAMTGATSYDIVRTNDGTNWVLVANQAGLTYSDQNSDAGNALPAYTLPTSNTTATGNDSTGDGTVGNPYATIGKAMSVSSAGDAISLDGFCGQVSVVSSTNGVNIFGSGRYSAEINLEPTGTFSTTHYPLRLPSNADVMDVTLSCELNGSRVCGCGTADTATVDCNLYRCNIRGYTNAFSVGVDGCGITFTDCMFSSMHGSIGMLAAAGNSVVNLTRCVSACGGPYGFSTPLCIQLSGGFILFRDTDVSAYKDSQLSVGANPTCFTTLTTTNVRGAVFVNCKLGSPSDSSQGEDWRVAATNLTGIWLMNTPYDPIKNPDLAALPPTVTSAGTYLADPVLATGGGNAATTGGNFRSNQSAVTSGGIFSETRT